LIDHGFSHDALNVTTNPISEMLSLQTADIKLSYKIISQHLLVANTERQYVNKAAQLLWSSVSKAIGEKNL